jgi:hypothetical protein
VSSRLARTSLADPRHLMRYLKAQAMGGEEKDKLAAIARAEGVSIQTVRQSVTHIDTYRKKNTSLEMDLAIRDLVISAVPMAKESLGGLLTATELVEVPNGTTGKKKVVRQPDKTTRLEANRLVKDLIVAVQPKGPMIEQNINQTNQVATLSSGAETNEERLRRLRKRADEFNQLPPEVAGVPDSIDSGEEDDDGDDEEEE